MCQTHEEILHQNGINPGRCKVEDQMTRCEKVLLLEGGICPDCGGQEFLRGPEGGCSTNIKCKRCGSEFNICPPHFAQRIKDSRPDPMKLAFAAAEAVLSGDDGSDRGTVNREAQAELTARLMSGGENPEAWRCRTCGAIHDGGTRCAYCGDGNPLDEYGDDI